MRGQADSSWKAGLGFTLKVSESDRKEPRLPVGGSASPPILVTGAHRSGTTWVGKMLTASGEAAYISEPFNRWRRPGVFRGPIQCWYTYVCSENSAEFALPYRQMLEFRYHFLDELSSLRSSKDAMRMLRDASTFLSGRLSGKRPLIKDPFAFFSTPWIAETFGCQVVIVVRHPAAFVSSLKRLDWPFDFTDLVSQPLLLRDWIAPFEQQMRRATSAPDDLIGNASLLWCVLYLVATKFIEAHPGFLLAKHEDLSRDPVTGFAQLYNKLALTFSEQAKKTVSKSSTSDNPKEITRQDIYGTRVDSQANLENWKKRLSAAEITRIRRITDEVSSIYYEGGDWAIQ